MSANQIIPNQTCKANRSLPRPIPQRENYASRRVLRWMVQPRATSSIDLPSLARVHRLARETPWPRCVRQADRVPGIVASRLACARRGYLFRQRKRHVAQRGTGGVDQPLAIARVAVLFIRYGPIPIQPFPGVARSPRYVRRTRQHARSRRRFRVHHRSRDPRQRRIRQGGCVDARSGVCGQRLCLVAFSPSKLECQ